jgi:hypothetical protein
MTAQPEALRLADALYSNDPQGLLSQSAAELRRLHAENEMLWKEREEPHQKIELYLRECNRLESERDELRKVNAELLEACKEAEWNSLHLPESVRIKLQAAIKKAEGEK